MSYLEKIRLYYSKLHRNINIMSYLKHPPFSVKSLSWNKRKIDEIIYMRDLRLWVIENAPHSKNIDKYYSEVADLQSQINMEERKSKKQINLIFNFLIHHIRINYRSCWFSRFHILLLLQV